MVAYDNMSRAELIETIRSLEVRPASSPSGVSSPPGGAARFPVFGEREQREFEASPHAIRIFDRETTKYLAVNDAALKLFGYTRAEFLNLTPLDTRHPDERPHFSATLAESTGYLRHRPPRRHVKKSGEIIVVEIITQDIVFDGRAARLSLTLDVTERVRTETLLRKREQEFSALVENAPDIITRFDRELRHVYVNPAVAAASGIARRAFMGKTHRELGMPEHLVAFWEQEIRRVFDSGEGQRTEFECPCRGELRYFEARVVPEFGADGATETVLVIARDITERKLASEIQANLAAIVESSPDAIVSRTPGGTFLSWNTGAERLFGYSAGEMVGKNARPIIPEDLVEESQRLRESVNEGNTQSQFETVRVTRDGRRIHVEISAAPIRDAAGNVSRVAAIFHDITARKRAEQALRDTEERLRLLLESTAEGIYGIDTKGKCTFVNPACIQMLGYHNADELLGQHMHERIHHTHPGGTTYPIEDCRIYRAFRLGEGTHLDNEVLWRADGTSFPVEYWSYPIRQDGEVIGAVVSFLDITERKRAELAMQRSAALARLLESLARAANEALTPEAAMAACLEHICIHGNWTLGRVALFERGKPEDGPPRSMWYAPERFAELIRVTNGRNHREGGGFINRVLREQAAVWIEDLQQVAGVGHIAIAAKQGLRTGFAFPIVVTGQVVALIEVLSTEPRPQDPLLMAAAQTIASQLARLVERAWAQESNARMAAIVESSQDAILSRTLDGTILTWNSAAERLFGYSAAEVLGRHSSLIVPTEQRQEAASRQALLEQGGRIPAFETVRITKDGRGIDVSVSASPIREDNGAVQAVSIIIRDITERKRAEDELKRQKKLLDAVIYNLPGSVFIKDAKTLRLMMFNRASRITALFPGKDAIGKTSHELFPKEQADAFLKSDRAALESGRMVEIPEQKVIGISGDLRIRHIRKVPVFDENGEPWVLVGIADDITDRKQAEDELRRQKKLLDAIIEHLPVGITVKDARTLRYTLRNRMATELTGLHSAEAIGKRAEDVYPPELAELIRASDREAMASGGPVSVSPLVVQRRTRRIVRNLKVPVPDDTGRYTHLVSIIEDLTDIEQAQAALRRSEERLRQLISMSPAAIFSFSLDPPLGTTFISENVTAQVGWQPSDFTSNPTFWLEHVHPEDRAHAEEALSKIAVDGKYVCEYRFRHKDGSWRWMRDEGQMVRDADNRPREAIGIWMDITAERMESEERLQRALRQRDALVREVHHRIKNNLQGVVGLLRQLAGEHREMRPLMDKAVSQLQAVAIVHGLQGRSLRDGILLRDLVPAIAKAIEETVHVPLRVVIAADGDTRIALSENEAVPIALALNEVMLNAAKYASARCERDEVRVTLSVAAEWARVTISNLGTLPLGFDFPGGKGVGTGLELVKSLLPQKGVSLAFSQVGDRVETTLEIFGPAVTQRATLPAQLESGRRASFPA